MTTAKNFLFRKSTFIFVSVLVVVLFILQALNSTSFKVIVCSNDSYASSGNERNSLDFVETLRTFQWDKLLHGYQTKKINTSEFSFWYSKLLLVLTPWIAAPPKVPVNMNKSCSSPPPLRYPFNAAPCKKLISGPRKVAVLLEFGFDADTLEIHLHELNEIVDKFFIVESTSTHYLGVSKPLIWEVLRRQQRFEMFLPKIVHFILDDQVLLAAQLEAAKSEQGLATASPVSIDVLQEKMRWYKFKEWNNFTKFFANNDLLGFGDMDEVPNRNVVHYLKNCEMPSDPVDIGSWFPFGRIDQAFISDAPVKGHPYTLGEPTYWTLQTALNYNGTTFWPTSVPSRLGGRAAKFIIGGMHMNGYSYFPFMLTKLLTVIEGHKEKVQNIIASKIQFIMNELQLNHSLGRPERFAALENMHMELDKKSPLLSRRIIKVAELKRRHPNEYKMIVQFPWFYNCNRQRYPAWEGAHDTRLI